MKFPFGNLPYDGGAPPHGTPPWKRKNGPTAAGKCQIDTRPMAKMSAYRFPIRSNSNHSNITRSGENIPKKIVSKIKKSLNKKKFFIHFFKASEVNKNIINVNKILKKITYPMIPNGLKKQ